MKTRLSCLGATVVCLCGSLSTVQVPAQDKPIEFNGLKGKIVAISDDVIQWTDATEAELYLKVDKFTKSKVTGDVEPSFLTPGVFVRFSAEISKRGKILGDIGELVVFSPQDGYSPGLYEDGVVDPKATSGKYFIAGQIEGSKNGLTTIDTGEQTFKFKLAEDVKITIEVADYSIARPDDEITVSGSGEQKTRIMANKIEIQLATPLAGPEKKGKKTTSSKKPSRRESAKRRDRPDVNDVDAPARNNGSGFFDDE